jgi:hypothetical protein
LSITLWITLWIRLGIRLWITLWIKGVKVAVGDKAVDNSVDKRGEGSGCG